MAAAVSSLLVMAQQLSSLILLYRECSNISWKSERNGGRDGEEEEEEEGMALLSMIREFTPTLNLK